jgi:UDP-glucose 4-epimerase
MKILVTGATGYIGSHLCKLLTEKQHAVTGWDIGLYGEANDVFNFTEKLYDIDVTNFGSKHKFDAVVHLAGRVAVDESVRIPYEYYKTNIEGTANCLDNIETDHFLFAGTAASWDLASPYALSKVAAEDIIKQKAKGYTIFRFFNVSGTNTIHKQLGNGTHLIRMVAKVAAGKKDTLQIFGNDWNTKDGTCVRDFIHVVDLANAIITAIEKGPTNSPYECLGTQNGYTVLEVVKEMEKVTGKKIPIEFIGRREGDIESSIVPEVSSLLNITKTLSDMCLDQYNLERNT